MRLLTSHVTGQVVVQSLGLGPGASLASTEAIAALLRRAAGFQCPCPARALVDAVHRSAGAWLGDDPRDEIWEVLDRLYLAGDLLEMAPREDGSEGKLVYLAAPAFLMRKTGAAYLQGVVPDHASGLPAEFEALMQSRGVVRFLSLTPETDWESLLLDLGFAPIAREHWLGAPTRATAAQHCARYLKRLQEAPAGGDTAAFIVIDPTADPTFYHGRRVEAGQRRGRFVGRRQVRYNRQVWCFVEIDAGRVLHLCDLHDEDDPAAGASEAWHLQMALDACAGTPQRFLIRADDPDLSRDEVALDLFSPVPRWAERRFEALGRRLPTKGRGALASFALPADEAPEETEFLTDALWLQPKA